MHLSPREIEKLMLHNAGSLAQKRLARGVRLNHPETVALIATVVLELIRDGRLVADLMDLGRRLLGRRQVMDGVPEMVHEVQVEGTFPDGTKLVTVHHPITLEDGDLSLALYGSFLPAPDLAKFGAALADGVPGSYDIAPGELTLNEGRPTVSIQVNNLGDRPIQVGSHYHFFETNEALKFDRKRTKGMRLDIAAGTAVRFEPGDARRVTLVELAGARQVFGLNGLTAGASREEALRRLAEWERLG